MTSESIMIQNFIITVKACKSAQNVVEFNCTYNYILNNSDITI